MAIDLFTASENPTMENFNLRITQANEALENAGGGGASLPPGGTTGQALVKASDTDGDVTWGGVTMEQVNEAIDAAITGAMEASY